MILLAGCARYDAKNLTIDGIYGIEKTELSFNNGIIDGFSDCNSLYGSYSIKGDSISILIGGTKVYCDGEINRHAINSTFKFKLNGNILTLHGSDYEILLTKID